MGAGGAAPTETRRYVQDERYFAKEHMDVRREALQIRTTLNSSSSTSMFAKVSVGATPPPLMAEWCEHKQVRLDGLEGAVTSEIVP